MSSQVTNSQKGIIKFRDTLYEVVMCICRFVPRISKLFPNHAAGSVSFFVFSLGLESSAPQASKGFDFYPTKNNNLKKKPSNQLFLIILRFAIKLLLSKILQLLELNYVNYINYGIDS